MIQVNALSSVILKYKQYCENTVSRLNFAKFSEHIIRGKDADIGEFPHVGASELLRCFDERYDEINSTEYF